MNCHICQTRMDEQFRATVLYKHVVSYFHCGRCGFLATEQPYWLVDAYKSPVNASDTGILGRNIVLSRLTSIFLFFLFGRTGRFVDYAGGYGLLARLMRDVGFDFYWHDPHCENLFARGFEYKPGTGTVDLVTCYEAVEHFVDPVAEFGAMLSISRNILFTTKLLPEPVPRPEEWWYYALEHGQHISFYSQKTLEFIAHRDRLNLYTDKSSFHFLTEKTISRGIFMAIPYLHRLGVAQVVRKLMKSRSIEDMDRIKGSNEIE